MSGKLSALPYAPDGADTILLPNGAVTTGRSVNSVGDGRGGRPAGSSPVLSGWCRDAPGVARKVSIFDAEAPSPASNRRFSFKAIPTYPFVLEEQ
jgi:hypothetical protein